MIRPIRFAACLLIGLLLLPGCSRAPSQSPEEDAGRRLFSEHCSSCHSLFADTVIVGPSLHGIGERAADNPLGLDARGYIRRSIVTPQADVVQGFPDLMPVDFERKLTGAQLDALIEFLLTQR